jgi:two-component system, OmpR family, phosphate regulon sensor histidine kinase PhoR
MTSPCVLIVDDDPALLEALPEALSLRMSELAVETCDSAPDALGRISGTDYDAIVTDIKMPGMDGLALLDEIRKLRPETPTLLITGHGEHGLAIQALRRGAYDYIQKPIDRDYFTRSLARAIEKRTLARRIESQRLELERHADVLEHVGDGVFVVDRGGVVRFWNHAAEEITGLAADQALGRPADELLDGWTAVAPSIPVAGTNGGGRQLARLLPFELDGREVWLSLLGVEVAEATVYSFQDRTDERLVEKLRDDFVATASHELRTPLAAIYGAAKTLGRPDVVGGDGMQKLIGIIAAESERLARVIDDILLASHLDSHRLRLAPVPLDVAELAEDVAESMRRERRPGLELAVESSDDLPAVAADPLNLRRVLLNLLDNAIKYSPEGGTIVVAIEADEDRLRVHVRDQGLGIPPGEQERIFEKFYRADPQLARGVGGTGLGLYICRELVQRMGGSIAVQSTPGEGSTFTVVLPVPALLVTPDTPVVTGAS